MKTRGKEIQTLTEAGQKITVEQIEQWLKDDFVKMSYTIHLLLNDPALLNHFAQVFHAKQISAEELQRVDMEMAINEQKQTQ